MSEPRRIADQLRRSIHGAAWHGPAVLEILADVTADEARRRPIPSAHSIAELVRHVTAWMAVAERRIAGHPTQPTDEEDWPPVDERTDWGTLLDDMRDAAERLCNRVSGLSDDDLQMRVRGMDQEYSAYEMLHGVAQHNLYHAGQMVLLKKALRA